MNQLVKVIYSDFKKANKVRKQQIAEKFGFKTTQEFIDYCENELERKETKKPVEAKEGLDMVIAFDTTGSMRTYIASVRKHVEQLVSDLFEKTPNLRMKIVAFGDYCDNAEDRYQTTSLTNNQEELIKFVKNAKDTGGGDGDEFYELVIKKVVEETDWREGVKKSFLLIGDATPHPLGYSYGNVIKNNQIDWKQEAHKAKEKGVQIDTLRITPSLIWYQELSNITSGVCLNFSNSNETSAIVEGLAYARGSVAEFEARYTTVMNSSDEELKGAYKQISKLL